MSKLKQLLHFPGSNFIIPMFLVAFIYTFFPSVLELGVPFTGFFTTEATFLIVAILLFVSGLQTSLEDLIKVARSIGPILILKILLTGLVTFIWVKLGGNDGWLGISSLAICATLLSCNPGMYLVLLGEDISEVEESSFSMVNLLMLPALPLMLINITQSDGLHVPVLMPLIASLLPFLIGMVVGSLFPNSRQTYAPLSRLLIPFLAVTFGAKINLIDALHAGPAGLVVTALFYVLMVLPLYLFDKQWNKNNGRMALSMHSIAAFSMSIPPFVASFIPSFEPFIAPAISQLALGVIITSFLTPYLFEKLVKK